MTAFVMLAAHAALAGLGGGVAWHPRLRSASLPIRLAAAFAAGAGVLTAWATLLALTGVRWNLSILAAPPAILSLAAGLYWARRRPSSHPARPGPGTFPILCWALVGGALLHLTVSCLTGWATSVDLLLFWGAKGLAFAESGGVAPPSLSGPFAIHTHLTYPPLYPLTLAWSILLSGSLPWTWVPLLTTLWMTASTILVYGLLRTPLGRLRSAAVVAFWSVSTCVILVGSHSGGNAEAPLLLYESVAVAALLGEGTDSHWRRVAAGFALAAAVLTKSEGAVAAFLVVGGTVLRDRRLRRPGWLRSGLALAIGPGAAALLWTATRVVHELPLSDPIRETAFAMSLTHVAVILRETGLRLLGDSLGLVWLVPLLMLALAGRTRWASLLPALCMSCGLVAFLLVYYLHATGDPTRLIDWTFSRVSLPAVSALILAAAFARPAGSACLADHQQGGGGEE